MGESYAHRVTYPPPPPGSHGQPANPDPRYGAPYGSQPGAPYGQPPTGSASGTPYGSQPPFGQPPASSSYGQPSGIPNAAGSGAPYGARPGADPYGYGASQQGYGGAYPGGYGSPRRKEKKTGLIVGIIAAVVVLLAAGGAGLYFGVMKGDDDDSGSKGGSTTSAAKLDPKAAIDLSKFDPCFVTPENFAGLAAPDQQTQKPKVAVEAEAFTQCRAIVHLPTGQGAIHVTTDSGKGVNLKQLASIPKSEVDASTEGPVGILKEKSQSDSQQCRRIVYQGDASGIEIETAGSGGFEGPVSKLCEAADIATTAAVAALRKNPPAQLTYTPDSYGALDPCSVFTAQDVDAAVGMSGSKGTATPDKHTCRWVKENDKESPIVKMEATLEPRPKTPSPILGSEQINVAGRDSLRKSSEPPGLGAVSCDITTAGKKWTPWIGFQNRLPFLNQPVSNDLIEYPNVEVIIPGGTKEQACQAAQSLAEKAWGKLPR